MEETALLRVVPFRSVFAGIALSVAVFFPIVLPGYSEAVRPQSPPEPRNIVIGFTGGFVKHDNRHHAPVQLAQRIRQTAPAGTYVEIFENRHRKQIRITMEFSPQKKKITRTFSYMDIAGERPLWCFWRGICSGRAFQWR
jgi:hypothetical protein